MSLSLPNWKACSGKGCLKRYASANRAIREAHRLLDGRDQLNQMHQDIRLGLTAAIEIGQPIVRASGRQRCSRRRPFKKAPDSQSQQFRG
jgi:hypothetical protein